MNTPQPTATGQALEQGFLLEELRIDPAAGEVSGPGGREKLDPKVMGVLVLMAQHAGQVVSHDELLTRLWPNAVVTDNALTRCFYELRRQLSQAGGSERYKTLIETLPKRGYRLNGEIRLPEPPPDSPPRWRPSRASLATAVAMLAAIVIWNAVSQRFAGSPADPQSPPPASAPYSIAVLPFDDMSADQSQAYLSDGVSEEILIRLARTRTMRVIARTSSFSFREQSAAIPEIAAKLNVSHVLEGSVRKSGDRVRITAQLIEASSNSPLWSETYDRAAGDLFAIQDEIAASVTTALSITLSAAAQGSLLPVSAEAYELFLKGEFFYNRRAPGDIERSVKYYQQALVIEPDYARPWAALAGAYSLLAFSGEMPREAGLAKQGEAARKAVALDPRLPVGYARLGQYHWDMGDRQTGNKMLETARKLDPDDALVLNFTAGMAVRDGDVTTGIEMQRRLIARDPLSASYHANLGTYLLAADRLEEARSELQKAQELNPNFGSGVELAIARILVLQKRFDEASSIIARLPEREARDHGLALLYQAMGRRAEADAAVERLMEQSVQKPDIRLAEVYAFRGMTEEAFAALRGIREAIDRDEPAEASQLWSWQVELRVSPFLKPLYADPRWNALLIEP